LSEADWADGFGLKFYGAMRLSRAAWSHLGASSGTIINIVGIGGRTGQAEFAIGGAVNAALLNLTKVLADRGVKDGVRVNAINPGGIATDRLQSRLRTFAAEHHVELTQAEEEMSRSWRRRKRPFVRDRSWMRMEVRPGLSEAKNSQSPTPNFPSSLFVGIWDFGNWELTRVYFPSTVNARSTLPGVPPAVG
jgi:NAD(P)-dependent dehydrogenase (short-subunit alcohol dehydrogenase family)